MERNPIPKTMNPILLVYNQSNIGLAGDRRHPVVEILNTVLADESILTMKTQGAYWHTNRACFLDLRNSFDQQLIQWRAISDEIAERVRVLGAFAISTFEEFLNYTRLKEQPGEAPDIMSLLSDHEASIHYLREDARMCFEEYGDHETYALFAHFIELHKKIASILRSFIEPEITSEESQGIIMQPMRRETHYDR